MGKFYAGTATIDEQWFLIKEDEELYNFIAVDMYGAITDCIHPEDFPRFEQAVRELKEKKLEKNCTAVRMRRYDGEYRWIVIEIVPGVYEMYGRFVYDLTLSDVEENANRFRILKQENQKYDTYLSMLDGIMLEYSIAEDFLEIYMVGVRGRIYLYQGTMDDWKQRALEEEIDVVYAENFQNLCNHLRSGRNITCEIMTRGFSIDGSMESCVFRCQMLGGSGEKKMMGCIIPYSKDNEKSFFPGTAYEKDEALDVLNKKSITEYARKLTLTDHPKDTVYFVILDLDNFKTVNDTFGHMFGDEVLANSARIIKEAVGNHGLVGRIGGDEMFLVIDRVKSLEELRNFLRTIRTNIEWSYKGRSEGINVTCSMGVAAYPDNGTDYEELFRIADKMLYLAKKKGRNRYIIYTPEIHGTQILEAKEETSLKNVEDAAADDREGIVLRMIDRYLIQKNVPEERLLREVGRGFTLDEIVIACPGMERFVAWTKEELSTDREKVDFLPVNDRFLQRFDKNQIFIVYGAFSLEKQETEIWNSLKEHELKSAILYQIKKDGAYMGYMVFGRKKNRQMWSEYEVLALAAVGKAVELVLGDAQ